MLFSVMLTFFIVICFLLIIIILVQPHYSESGLAGAFGGGGSDSFFGTKAVSIASKVTVVLAIIFILLAIVLNKLPQKAQEGGVMSKEPAPVTAPEFPQPSESK